MSSVINNSSLMDLPKPKYEYITSEDRAREVLSVIDNYPILEVDTEGTSLDPYSCKTTLIQIGVPNMAYVFDVRSDLPYSNIHGSLFSDILSSKKHLKLLQNANYDMKVLKAQFGFYIENIYDTMIAEQLMYLGIQESGFSLDALVAKYLNMNMSKEPRGTFQTYDQDFTEKQLMYAANDVCTLDIIRSLQLPRIQKYNLQEVLTLELSFVKALAEMELNGVKLDIPRWRIMMAEFTAEAKKFKAAIEKEFEPYQDQFTLFGISNINIDSNAQLKTYLNKMGLNLESTAREALEKYSGHPIIDRILQYRKDTKLINTYGEALIEKINPKTGRLHTRFKQMVSTGRMSSNDPNLQNIPGKQKFRSCFIADPGKVLITVDQNSAELMIMGAMSGEPNFIETYEKGLDLHTVNASRVYGVPYDKVTKDQRKASKAISFGLCVDENSNLFLGSGIRKIKDIAVGDIVANDIGHNEVIDMQYMGEKECFEIKTKYGYSISATEDHLIKTIDAEGNYVDKKLKDIDIAKDFVCLKLGSNIFPKKEYMFEEFNVDKCTNYKHMVLPKSLNVDLARFLGLFISEGSIQKVKDRTKYSSFSCSLSANVDGGEFIHAAFSLFKRLFKNRLTTMFISENRTVFSYNSVLFCEWVMSLFDDVYVKNKDIHIPDCIKQSPRQIQVEFIKWLFEGDGTHKAICNGCRIEYSSKSERLVQELQLMLLNLGILSTIRFESRKGYLGERYFTLHIVGKDSYDLFMSEIGFVTYYKTTHCKYSADISNISSYYLPNQHDLLNKIKEEYYKTTNKCYSEYDLIRNCIYNTKGNIGNLNIDKISYLDSSGFLEFMKGNGIVPLAVKSIKPVGTKSVYDISVDEHQYFLANGFIVHNCYGISAVGLGRRLGIRKEEAQKLIDVYFKVNNVLSAWLNAAAKDAVRTHSSTTITGRHRFYNIPAMSDPARKKIIGSVERAAKNHRIQGSDSDTIKKAMVLCVERLEKSNTGAKILLSVHDELVVESPIEHAEEVAKIVTSAVDDGFNCYFPRMPMHTDPVIGPCWIKGECSNKVEGKECGHNKMVFIEDEHYITKLVCGKCGAPQE